MDGIHPHFTLRTFFSFLLLILLQTSTEAQEICSAPTNVPFAENNTVDALVTTITVQDGVTMTFRPPPANPNNPFRLDGNRLIATRVLDFETEEPITVTIDCRTASGLTSELVIVVTLINLNDNPPVFDSNSYQINVNEMSPVDTSVGRFPANDLDLDTIYYTLTPESNGFKLMSSTNPVLLVGTPLEYDKVKTVQMTLHAQDTPLEPPNIEPSFTASTTITVTIVDVDNRPPWFKPCTEHEIGSVLVCQSSGYTGAVVLNEQEPGVLPLEPGPLYAIDGDSGINEAITYSFISGNDDRLFEINPNTGNISMLKPTDKLGPFSLTVLAAQRTNSHQFATTTVTISVQVKSLHPPQFQRPHYEAIVTEVGAMAMDSKDEPLRILATDEDYAATGGLNPKIDYYVNGSSDFSIVNGYLFMTKDLPEGTLSLQVVAIDTSNEESATAQLSVEVKSGLSTTSVPLSTTDLMDTTSIGESTTNSKTTEDISVSATATSDMPTDSGLSTTTPSLTVSTASTAHAQTEIAPSGSYGPEDMAALGATLGVLLFICLVVILVLVIHLRKGKADWRKIYETSMFRSSLGQGSGSQKEGIQYTNDAFQNDEDGNSTGRPEGGSIIAEEPIKPSLYDNILMSTTPRHALPSDDISQAGSDKADSEKDVKPILTKERRMDEGYKSVWFKEDIDPDAKEEVVIIPDSRENDSEEEYEDEEQPSSSREEDEDDNLQTNTPNVVFNDADMDSGLGVKLEEPEEDSEDDEVLTVDL